MSKRLSQKELVRRLLLERGDSGVGAHELTYQHGITRAAAIVFELRNEGMLIETKEKRGEQAVYVFHPRARGSIIAEPKTGQESPYLRTENKAGGGLPLNGQATLFSDAEAPLNTANPHGRAGAH